MQIYENRPSCQCCCNSRLEVSNDMWNQELDGYASTGSECTNYSAYQQAGLCYESVIITIMMTIFNLFFICKHVIIIRPRLPCIGMPQVVNS